MKKLLVLFIVLVFSLPAWAQDSKEFLKMKLQSLSWEFKSHQAEVQLRQIRMQDIKDEAIKVEALLKELGKKPEPAKE